MRNATLQPQFGRAEREPSPQSMVERLKADWGKADSPWDLNGDGTVNVRDFLKLLAKMAGGANDALPPPTQPEAEAPPNPVDDGDEQTGTGTWADQLRADWGKTDSLWDLNGDGTVNVRDFLKVLGMMGGDVGDAPPPPPTAVRPDAEAIPGAVNGGEHSDHENWLDQLRADWGKTDSPWDLNGDGTVNVRDFLKMLARISGGEDAPTPPPTEVRPSAEAIPDHTDNDTVPPERGTWVDQLLADWGGTNSLWDLNGDSIVNVRDFLKVLAMMGQDVQQHDAAQERDPPRVGHEMRRARAAYNPITAQDMALIRRGLSFNAVG
ncbi:MAG: hypothetical protein ACYSWT_08115 [Planctomycetota bacterium]